MSEAPEKIRAGRIGRRFRTRRRWQIAAIAGIAALLAALLAGCGSHGGGASGGGTSGGTSASGTSGSATSSASAGTAVTPTTDQAATNAAHLDWSACTAAEGPTGYQCATLRVPRDYSHPSAGTIGIALDRHRATGHASGSIVEDPGGPGVSGIEYLPDLVAEMPAALLQHFNIVGFDPRGVDHSDPITCGTGPQLDDELDVDPSPTTAAGWQSLLAADRKFVAGCEQRSGSLLSNVGTVDAARDMDRIRAVLGESKLNYLGFSYGTYLGAVYAELYPHQIRAMVLDGAIDPALSQVAAVTAQSKSLVKELDAFFASCDKGQCGWQPSGGASAAYQSLLAKVTAQPMAVSGATQKVGPAALLYGTAAALYSTSSWPVLGQSLNALASGNATDVLELFDEYMGRASNGTYSNEMEAETAIDCESYPVPSLSTIHADGAAIDKAAGAFGLLDLYSLATCAMWPAKADLPVGPLHATGSPTIVVVGSTGDPITPYAWAQALASQLQHGVLLTRDGYGHTGYGASTCIRADVDEYFLHLKAPAGGTTCPSN